MNLRLRDEIEEYVPFDEAEEKIQKYLLRSIESFDDVLTRENEFGHFTSSAFVINKDRTKMLVVYHNIFGAWVFSGCHADGEEDLLSVAIREVKEETNLKTKVLEKDIFAISASPIIGHVKRGKYVPAHTHLDVVYLLEASENDELAFRSDESKGVKWMTFEEAVGDDVVDFIRPVHRRIIEKLKSEKYSNL